MPYHDVNGQHLYYEDTGTDGPPVVFAHGYLMDHEMWRPQVEALGDRYRCITFDERGWGQTEADGKPFDFWDLADDCIGLLDALDIDQAVLGGMSQGGFLSLRATLRHPERVRGLVLVDTDPFEYDEAEIAAYQAMMEQGRANGIDDNLATAIGSILFGPTFDGSLWFGKWRARPITTGEQAFECLIHRDDVSDRLGEITCPTLVMHGEVDAAFPFERVAGWAEKIPGLTGIVPVPDAGHTSPLERPDVVNPRLEEFLAALA